jgi:hypothetical protein
MIFCEFSQSLLTVYKAVAKAVRQTDKAQPKGSKLRRT